MPSCTCIPARPPASARSSCIWCSAASLMRSDCSSTSNLCRASGHAQAGQAIKVQEGTGRIRTTTMPANSTMLAPGKANSLPNVRQQPAPAMLASQPAADPRPQACLPALRILDLLPSSSPLRLHCSSTFCCPLGTQCCHCLLLLHSCCCQPARKLSLMSLLCPLHLPFVHLYQPLQERNKGCESSPVNVRRTQAQGAGSSAKACQHGRFLEAGNHTWPLGTVSHLYLWL